MEQHGNVASNKVCGLATVGEVERLTGYRVRQVDGLNPGYSGDADAGDRGVPDGQVAAVLGLVTLIAGGLPHRRRRMA